MNLVSGESADSTNSIDFWVPEKGDDFLDSSTVIMDVPWYDGIVALK